MCSLSDAEKLIIYYGVNLYLLKDDDSALKINEKYAEDIKGSDLFEANISRILGLIHLRKGDMKEAVRNFTESLELYKKTKSLYGIALCSFAMGYVESDQI